MSNGRATQKDVAKAAGVSQATVSMVLSGGGASIPAETWARITKAAKDLGYVHRDASLRSAWHYPGSKVTNRSTQRYPPSVAGYRLSVPPKFPMI